MKKAIATLLAGLMLLSLTGLRRQQRLPDSGSEPESESRSGGTRKAAGLPQEQHHLHYPLWCWRHNGSAFPCAV